MAKKKVWVWDNNSWREAIEERTWGFVNKSVIFLDNLEEKVVPVKKVSEVRPTKPYGEEGGTKMKITYARRFVLNDEYSETRISEYLDRGDIWEELYDAKMEVEYTVLGTEGYDNTHICGYCEEYSSSNTDVRCKGCGHQDWTPWEELEYAPTRYNVGDVVIPD
jgi:hypothetical protein